MGQEKFVTQPQKIEEQIHSQTKLKRITLGVADFNVVRDDDTLFIDKTAKLQQLVFKKKVFLSRPRRLGKSTLTSMLEQLFTNGIGKFEGFAVYNLWQEDRYPVVRISFFGMNNPDTIAETLRCRLCDAFEHAGFDAAAKIKQDIRTLDEVLGALDKIRAGQKIVVLIDEWDLPLSSNLHDITNFEKCKDVLNTFYSWIRDLRNLHFLFVTGIGRYKDTSLFTGQDIKDISMEPDFADIVGYTQEELETNFAPYISESAKRLGISNKELLAKIKIQYDGFCFDSNASVNLYNPWSINNFFSQVVDNSSNIPSFPCYWMSSSNAYASLRSFLKRKKIDLSFLTKVKNEDVEIRQSSISSPNYFNSVSMAPLMVSMGYLTIKKDLDPGEESPYLHFYSCGFPNNEVERECDALFLEYLSNHEDKDIEVDNSEGGSEENFVKMHEQDVDGMFIASRQLRSALNQRDMAQAVICLNTQMHSLRYDAWRNTYEVVYRSLIAAFLRVSGGARFVVEEKGNHLGRSDIEADIGNDHFVFELKRIADNHNPNATKRLAEAAHQQIIDNGYCDEQATNVEKWHGVVLVIDDSVRQIVYWRHFCQKAIVSEGFVEPITIDNPPNQNHA